MARRLNARYKIQMESSRKRKRDLVLEEPLIPEEDRYFEHYENYKIRIQLKKGIKVLVSRTVYILLPMLMIILLVCIAVLLWQVIVLSKHAAPVDNPHKSGLRDSSTFILKPNKLTLDLDGGNESMFEPKCDTNIQQPWKNPRLPRDVLPVHYDLLMSPDFDGGNHAFYGNVIIEIKVHRNTDYVILHTHGLNITKVKISNFITGQHVRIIERFEYEANDYLVIRLAKTLEAGEKFKLDVTFSGPLSMDKLYGLYKSSYTNTESGAKRNLVATKFEPVSARMAFPCFDEPNIKAEFTIRLVHGEEYIGLSNMPVEGRAYKHKYHDLLETKFQRSVKMSTYLVCFIVCDFEYLEARTKSGVLIRVYATPDKKQQGQFALEVANHTLTFYEDLFAIKFPLPKLDLIALPAFESGAMENWGLMTFRESTLLYNEDQASSADKQLVAMVVAHELVHQWFGNLVTMDTWDHVWLNEGFAKFMEYLGVMALKPEWNTPSQFLVRDYQAALDLDAGLNSHPIVFPVQDPNELNVVFDVIEYKKAASMIRMLENILGHKTFFNGIQNYLRRHNWYNAETDDLWQALDTGEDASDVKTIMDTWTNQMGYPLIDVTFAEKENRHVMSLTQTRCLVNSELNINSGESPFEYKWYISVDYRTSEDMGKPQRVWMDMTDVDVILSINPHSSDEWIKLNSHVTGFYRVNYPIFMWRKFASMLQKQPDIFSDEDKFGLLNDALYLAQYGYLDYDIALDLTLYIEKENGYLPWAALSAPFAHIRNILKSFPADYKLWKRYVTNLVRPALNRLGWEDSGTHLQKLLRSVLIEISCSHGDTECLSSALNLFLGWLQSGDRIPANLREHVYVYGMQHNGTEEQWNQLWRMYMTQKFPQEKSILEKALANTKDERLSNRYLSLAKTEASIPSQDFVSVLKYISRNPFGGDAIAKRWIISNWDYLTNRFSLFSKDLARVVPYVFGASNTEEELSEILDFFKTYPEAGAGARGRIETIEKVKANIEWTEKHKQAIVEWLKDKV